MDANHVEVPAEFEEQALAEMASEEFSDGGVDEVAADDSSSQAGGKTPEGSSDHATPTKGDGVGGVDTGSGSPNLKRPRQFVGENHQSHLMERFGRLLKGKDNGNGAAEAAAPEAQACCSSVGCITVAQAVRNVGDISKKSREGEDLRINIYEGGRSPCFVCGILYAAMPDKSPFCFKHKRNTDTMRKQWAPPPRSAKPESLPPQEVLDLNAKQLALYKKLLKAKAPPPSYCQGWCMHICKNAQRIATGVVQNSLYCFFMKSLRESHDAGRASKEPACTNQNS